MTLPNKKAVKIYEYFCGKYKEHADLCPNVISFNKAKGLLGRYAIPKQLRMILINEMIDFGYLEFIRSPKGLQIHSKPLKIIEDHDDVKWDEICDKH